jgi:hypothetical protein
MIFAEERQILKARQAFERLLKFVQAAEKQDLRIDLLEREALAMLLRVGFELLEHYIARCGDGDMGETTEADDGRTLRRLEELRDRRYVSIFGEHNFSRYVYAQREGQKIERMPVDEQLGLPEGSSPTCCKTGYSGSRLRNRLTKPASRCTRSWAFVPRTAAPST